ncbi:hypothetical protein ES702_07700 [subsurface metagenome]
MLSRNRLRRQRLRDDDFVREIDRQVTVGRERIGDVAPRDVDIIGIVPPDIKPPPFIIYPPPITTTTIKDFREIPIAKHGQEIGTLGPKWGKKNLTVYLIIGAVAVVGFFILRK